MSYRYKGRAFTDATSPRAFGICDRCGFQWNLYQLQYQYQYNGTTLYNTRYRVCPTCMDVPQPQLLNPILPPDPLPVNDPRPPAYSVNEAGTFQILGAQILSNSEFGSTFYIDLFNGNPQTGAQSVLSSITGGSTRTNFAASMSSTNPSVNTETIVIASDIAASTNISWIGVYDAATSGTLLMSAPLLTPMTAVLYNILQFHAGDLQVSISTTGQPVGLLFLLTKAS